MSGPFRRILLVGCNECVTVCAAGGRKEVGLLASALHMAFLKSGENIEIREHTLERQCDPEYVEELVPMIDGVDAVMSMACGCGVQEVARRFKDKPVFPAVNTKFMGASERQGVWAERCQGCGDCLLGRNRRGLPHRPVLQTVDERPLRRFDRRHIARSARRGLRLAADLGPAQGAGTGGPLCRNHAGQGLATGWRRRPEKNHQRGFGRMKTESRSGKILAAGHLAVTSECGPPRGAVPEKVREKGRYLAGNRRCGQCHRQPDGHGAHVESGRLCHL